MGVGIEEFKVASCVLGFWYGGWFFFKIDVVRFCYRFEVCVLGVGVRVWFCFIFFFKLSLYFRRVEG